VWFCLVFEWLLNAVCMVFVLLCNYYNRKNVSNFASIKQHINDKIFKNEIIKNALIYEPN
jgi:hypothetical protein